MLVIITKPLSVSIVYWCGRLCLQPAREHVGLGGGSARPPEPSLLPREDGSSGYGSPDSDSLEAQWHPHPRTLTLPTSSGRQDLTKRHLLHIFTSPSTSTSTLSKWPLHRQYILHYYNAKVRLYFPRTVAAQ